MALITSMLGIADSDFRSGRISEPQYRSILQESIDNGDVSAPSQLWIVLSVVCPLICSGGLRMSPHLRKVLGDIVGHQDSGECLGETSNWMRGRSAIECMSLLQHGWIATHQEVFGFSWRRVLPIPFLWAPARFDQYAARLTLIADELRKLTASFDHGVGDEATSEHIALYGDSLKRCLWCLCVICGRLALRANRIEEYSREQYRADCDQYGQLREQILARGTQLNRVIFA